MSSIHDYPEHSRSTRAARGIEWVPELENESKECQTMIVMAGVALFIVIVLVLAKLNVSNENIISYAPVIWLLGIPILCIVINTIRFLKERRLEKELRRANLESLLAGMALPQSFPCLLPGPHDECCGGRGIVHKPLPTYEELFVENEIHESHLPPDYTTAMTMLQTCAEV